MKHILDSARRNARTDRINVIMMMDNDDDVDDDEADDDENSGGGGDDDDGNGDDDDGHGDDDDDDDDDDFLTTEIKDTNHRYQWDELLNRSTGQPSASSNKVRAQRY
ncbi:hypothetical protein N9L68_01535 [bacterium]|nr:hypothetical protein [bacterium]